MKYKTILTIFLFLQLPVAASAQDDIDTLLIMLAHHPKEDTTRLLIWATLAKEYAKVDLDKGISASDTVIRLAKKLRLPGWEANAYNAKGAASYYKGDYKAALQFFEQARSMAEQIGNKRRIWQSVGNIAGVYVAMCNFMPALDYYQKQVTLAAEINQQDGVSDGYCNIGSIYAEMAQYPQALEYAQKGMHVSEVARDTDNLKTAFNILAKVYTALNDHGKAADYCKRSLLIDEAAGDRRSMVEDFNNLAANLESSNEFSEAIRYRKEALTIVQEMGMQAGLLNLLVTLGYDFARIAEFRSALEHNTKAEKMIGQFSDTISRGLRWINLGYIYANMPSDLFLANGLDTTHRFSRSQEYLLRGLKIATDMRKLDFQRDAWNYISLVHEKQGNYSEALEAYQNFVRLRDSIINDEKKKEILRLEIEYEFNKKGDSLKLGKHVTDEKLKQQLLLAKQQQQQLELDKTALALSNKAKDIQRLAYLKAQTDLENEQLESQGKEKQVALLKQEKQLQLARVNALTQATSLNALKLRQQWFYVITGLVLLGFISSYFFYRARLQQVRLKNEIAAEKIEKQQKEAEFQRRLGDISLSALRSQMNPHFIFNCLNSIKLYTTKNDTAAASEYLTKFSKLIRLVLENSRNERITLSSDLDALRLYVEMEAMRFKEKLMYDLFVENDVELDFIDIPPLLLQPYVENAIWHGLMHKEEGGKIDIHVGMEHRPAILIITITDNGVGRAKSAELKSKTATKHKSYGMKVTSERLDLINRVYKTGASVVVDDLLDQAGGAAGTRVTIRIPIE